MQNEKPSKPRNGLHQTYSATRPPRPQPDTTSLSPRWCQGSVQSPVPALVLLASSFSIGIQLFSFVELWHSCPSFVLVVRLRACANDTRFNLSRKGKSSANAVFSLVLFSLFNSGPLALCGIDFSCCDSVSTLGLTVEGVSRRFRSHVPAVVLRQLGSQISVCSDMFPQPRARYGPHCQFVSDALWASGMRSTFLPWFLTSFCDSGFNGTWFLEASMLSEMCPQLQLSTSISPRCLRDVSKALFHLWLLWPLRSPLGVQIFSFVELWRWDSEVENHSVRSFAVDSPCNVARLAGTDSRLRTWLSCRAVCLVQSVSWLRWPSCFCVGFSFALRWIHVSLGHLTKLHPPSTVCLMLVVQPATCCDHVRRWFCCLSSEVCLSLEVLLVSSFFYWAHLCLFVGLQHLSFSHCSAWRIVLLVLRAAAS